MIIFLVFIYFILRTVILILRLLNAANNVESYAGIEINRHTTPGITLEDSLLLLLHTWIKIRYPNILMANNRNLSFITKDSLIKFIVSQA